MSFLSVSRIEELAGRAGELGKAEREELMAAKQSVADLHKKLETVEERLVIDGNFQETRVCDSSEHHLLAIWVPDDLTTRADIVAYIYGPYLYFIPQWKKFAFRLGGSVLIGSLGSIDGGGRVLDCGRAKCGGGCRRFHDPELFPGSTETRDFEPASWIYTGADARGARVLRAARRIGSAARIGADLQSITRADAKLFIAQTVHDVLIAMLIERYTLF